MNFDRSALKDKRLVEAGKKAGRESHSKEQNHLVKREFSQGRMEVWRLLLRHCLFDEGIKVENLRIFMHFPWVVYLRQTNNAIKADRFKSRARNSSPGKSPSWPVRQSVTFSPFNLLKNAKKQSVMDGQPTDGLMDRPTDQLTDWWTNGPTQWLTQLRARD